MQCVRYRLSMRNIEFVGGIRGTVKLQWPKSSEQIII
jgi:hypothetical protein